MPIEQKDLLVRFGVIYVLIFAFGIIVIGKIFFIQNVDNTKWKEQAETYKPKQDDIPASRGDIYAADGRVLATSVPYYKIRMDLGAEGVKKIFNKNVDALADSFATVIRDKSKARYKRELINAFKKGRRYHLVSGRSVSFMQLQRIKTFPILNKGKFAGGFIVVQEDKRLNPHKSLASRTIGVLNKGLFGGVHGNIGNTGIEGKCEHFLRGKDGVSIKQNLSGRWVPITETEPEDGLDVITTIDVNFQDAAESALHKQLIKSRAEYGTAILMEVETGDIKAIANLGKNKSGEYSETYNYALGSMGCSEPGSTFKLVSLMIAMEQGYVDTTDVFNVEHGHWKYGGLNIYDSDYHHGGHEDLTVKEIFEKSSNVGVAKVITKYYEGREEDYINRIYKFGFNNKLGVGIKGEGTPRIKYPTDKDWWANSLAFISYGYEFKITPLHTLTFYNAVANQGKMVKPRLVKGIRRHGTVEETFPVEVMIPSICSSETLGKAQAMLEGVVERGTGRRLKSNNYSIAGKTGTAQVANNNEGYYHEGKRVYQASFAGYFPADKPKYSCIVVIVGPKGGVYYGGSVAGPVFREISDKVYTTNIEMHVDDLAARERGNEIPRVKAGIKDKWLPVVEELGIEYQNSAGSDLVSFKKKGDRLVAVERKVIDGLVPNVVGMGAKDAVYVLENSGLKVRMRGVGKVVKQSLLPGKRIRKGQTIYINLS
ncbi:PASTA domain-containing protein [Puteibacter caeruleilacunae]|nr:PASTA domain-containing protein [Puteibacter caeruleilacunae]